MNSWDVLLTAVTAGAAVGATIAAAYSASAARQAVVESVRPVMIHSEDGPTGTESRHYLPSKERPGDFDITVPIRNVGLGPAFFRDAFFLNDIERLGDATVRPVLTPAGQPAVIRATIPSGTTGIRLEDPVPQFFVVGVQYSDVRGQKFQSIIRLSTMKEQGLRVEQVQLFKCDPNWIPNPVPFVETLGSSD
jgi:hypothetical protein